MAVLYTNNASSTLASSITNSATSIALATGTGAKFPAVSGTDVFYATLQSGSGVLEIVKCTARSGDTLTVVRGQDGTSASTFSAGDIVELRITKAMLDQLITDTFSVAATLSNKTFTGYTETVYVLGTSGSIALNPANGTIQTCAAAGTVTFTDSLSAGQSIVLMLTGGVANTINWPTTTWVGSSGNVAPTLTASTTLVFWKVSTTLYGSMVGSYA